ncbi:HGGxSTG domain-containing protein [Roseinatronobacter monicus]|uniref:HGGxSTG domain-containing protein n=1 Tax=Roseinatronobacter monicus TaxID=393481 RepID=UPI00114E5F2E
MREKGLDDDGLPLLPKNRPQCGARARSGAPCKHKVIPGKRRCKYHGGRSTGPKTDAGKAKIAAAQILRWKKWRGERKTALARREI